MSLRPCRTNRRDAAPEETESVSRRAEPGAHPGTRRARRAPAIVDSLVATVSPSNLRSIASSERAEIVQMADPAARAQAAELLTAGEIIIIPFNGIFVLVGDADDPAVPVKIAAAKQRPQAKGVALVCPPEFLDEHVMIDPAGSWTLTQVQNLYTAVHAVGVILPAADPGAPRHVVQAGTILNVWTEERPSSPLRELVLELRRHGRRALGGTSANQSGRPTITDPAEVTAVFAPRVAMILLDTFERVSPARRRSASIVDLTGSGPRLTREGSVPGDELREHLRRLQLGELAISADVPRV